MSFRRLTVTIDHSKHMALPLLAHCDLDPNCYGCLVEIVENTSSRFICNECGIEVSLADVQRLLFEMKSCEAECPHCGRLNEFPGFCEIFAYHCRFCREAVTACER